MPPNKTAVAFFVSQQQVVKFWMFEGLGNRSQIASNSLVRLISGDLIWREVEGPIGGVIKTMSMFYTCTYFDHHST